MHTEIIIDPGNSNNTKISKVTFNVQTNIIFSSY